MGGDAREGRQGRQKRVGQPEQDWRALLGCSGSWRPLVWFKLNIEELKRGHEEEHLSYAKKLQLFSKCCGKLWKMLREPKMVRSPLRAASAHSRKSEGGGRTAGRKAEARTAVIQLGRRVWVGQEQRGKRRRANLGRASRAESTGDRDYRWPPDFTMMWK